MGEQTTTQKLCTFLDQNFDWLLKFCTAIQETVQFGSGPLQSPPCLQHLKGKCKMLPVCTIISLTMASITA